MVYRVIKRAIDAVFSLFLLILLLPLFLLIVVLIRCETPGNGIFTQHRCGRYGKPFVIYKFRTMRTDAPHNVATVALRDPDRYITRVGRFLRKTSLDELPQLLNVLKGDMSFVGPRPVVLTERDLIRLRRRNGADRVRPGMTGLAQVSGRDTVTVYEKARYDAQYAKRVSLWLDMRIVLLTFRCMLADSHAAHPLS